MLGKPACADIKPRCHASAAKGRNNMASMAPWGLPTSGSTAAKPRMSVSLPRQLSLQKTNSLLHTVQFSSWVGVPVHKHLGPGSCLQPFYHQPRYQNWLATRDATSACAVEPCESRVQHGLGTLPTCFSDLVLLFLSIYRYCSSKTNMGMTMGMTRVCGSCLVEFTSRTVRRESLPSCLSESRGDSDKQVTSAGKGTQMLGQAIKPWGGASTSCTLAKTLPSNPSNSPCYTLKFPS